MAAALTPPTRHSESERLRRRRDRHARLATDGVMTEVAFALRARQRRDRDFGVGRELEAAQGTAVPRSSERPARRRDHWAMGRPLLR
jgi:hypothetical protein